MKSIIIMSVCLLMFAISGCTLSENKTKTVLKQDNTTIFNKEWKWQVSQYNNDTQIIVPHPENYTILLKDNGNFNVRLDCNRGGGKYVIDNNTLKLELLFSTRAMCSQNSLDQLFIKDLSRINSFFIKDGVLYLELQYHTGTMHFAL